MKEPMLITADPIHRVVEGGANWRWYQPNSRYTAPENPLVSQILDHFKQTPKSMGSFSSTDDGAMVQQTLVRLMEAGFLIDTARCAIINFTIPATPSGATERVAAAPTIFNVPAWQVESRQQATVLGVFYGGGGPNAGVINGPTAIRRLGRTFVYQVDAVSGVPVGFFDLEQRRRILRGLTLADAGDLVPKDDKITLAELGADLVPLVKQLRLQDSLVLLLGGDHSITALALQAFAGQPFQLVQIDAHLDLDLLPVNGGFDHASMLSELCRMDALKRIVQVGARGCDDPRFEHQLAAVADKLVLVPQQPGEDLGVAVREVLDPDLPCYVSLDVDALDPSISGGSHYLAPGGLHFSELIDILRSVASSVPALGMDIVELVPENDLRGQTTHICTLALLAYLDAWWQGNCG